MNILVSACLLGMECRYNASGQLDERILALKEYNNLIPVCPEQLGGLPTPREPVELSHGRALTNSGKDVTAAFEKGAEETLKLAQTLDCAFAILKSRSPSCGSGEIHDGSFSGALVPGSGITARKLTEAGIKVYSSDDFDELCNN